MGLALAALGVLLGFVLYPHWDGGSIGDWFARALALPINHASARANQSPMLPPSQCG